MSDPIEMEPQTERMLAQCRALLDLADSVIDPWRGRETLDRAGDGLLLAFLMRSTKSFRAVVLLAENGFGEQGAMVARSLFEDAVDAHWVTLDPEHAERLYADHHAHTRLLWIEVLNRYPSWGDPIDLSDDEEQARERLDETFGKHGTKSWTTLNIFNRVGAIEHLWSDGGAELRAQLEIVHRSNNQHLHASATALDQTAEIGEDGALTFHAQPSSRFVDQALVGASWAYLQTVSLAVEWFDLPIDEEVKAWSAEWGSQYGSEGDS